MIELLSVVMPAYNEEAAVENVVLDHVRVLETMVSSVPRWEIVVVDDGSKDRTPNVLESLRARVPQLRVVRQENQGIFGAVTRAYSEALGSHIYSTGSDGQWPASNLPKMMEVLNNGADLVIGLRSNRHEVYTASRRFVSFCFNRIAEVAFGVAIRDAGSVKLGRRDVFRMKLVSHSPFFEAERIVRAQRAGFRIDFVPILFGQRTGGRSTAVSWKNVESSVFDMARFALSVGLGRQEQPAGELLEKMAAVPHVVEREGGSDGYNAVDAAALHGQGEAAELGLVEAKHR
jgi:glycosyltransferase involved in cell wall biosynthesis